MYVCMHPISGFCLSNKFPLSKSFEKYIQGQGPENAGQVLLWTLKIIPFWSAIPALDLLKIPISYISL